MKTKDAPRGRMSDASRWQSEARPPAASHGQRRLNTTHPNKLWLTTIGPALVLAAWDQVAEAQSTNFNYTGSFQTWTVPATGLYRITAFGASAAAPSVG